VREIKFRMLEDYGWKFFTLPDDLEDWEGNVSLFYSKENTLCQYTGLKDKNGKEIYEGDVLKSEEKIYEVYWDKDDAHFSPLSEHISNRHAEVIGNVHENKEELNV